MQEVFIVAAKRTAIGSFLGTLSAERATDLGAAVIRDAYTSVCLNAGYIEAVYFGNVLSAGLGQSPARQASLMAGLPASADCTTINKVCASGMKAVVAGAQDIQLGLAELVMTGGMESMSNAPHYSYQRKLTKLGDTILTDGLLKDGLTDPYHNFHMGNAAEMCACTFNISRQEQDDYALSSYSKAAKATKAGKFKSEITALKFVQKNQNLVFDEDEDINKLVPAKVAILQPVFEKNGTITAANASNLNDGAAALLLASATAVKKYGLRPLAKIISYADAAQAPEKFTTAPSLAIPRALRYAGLELNDISWIEINEAYAAVAIANQRILQIDPEKMNTYGGAVALGHPLGASGARILCTLISILKQEDGRYGLAAICNGGGGATAMIIENINSQSI